MLFIFDSEIDDFTLFFGKKFIPNALVNFYF